MEALYLIIQQQSAGTPVHIDLASPTTSATQALIVRAMTWVMRVKNAKPLESVQYWFQDGADYYVAARSKEAAELSLCSPVSDAPIYEWSREAIVVNTVAALDDFCDWRLDHGRPTNKKRNLATLRETSEIAAQATAQLAQHDKTMSFFRHYRELERLHQCVLKAQQTMNRAESALWNTQTFQLDLIEALKHQREIQQQSQKLQLLRQEAQRLFANKEAKAKVHALHNECTRIEKHCQALQTQIDATIDRYRLRDQAHDVVLDKVDETAAREKAQLTHAEQQFEQAQREFECFRLWLRLHSALQRAEELTKEDAHY